MAKHSPSPRPWSRRTEVLAAGGLWLVLGLLTVVRESLRPWRGTPLTAGETAYAFVEFALWALLTPLVFWLAQRPSGREVRVRRLAIQLLVGVGIALSVESLTRGLFRPILVGPPPDGIPFHEWTLAGTIRGLWFLDEFIVFLAVLAVGYARDALFHLRERQAEAERLLAERAVLEGQLAEARLSALRMQLNPHFLFNTLNAVSALVERDPAGVRTMIARLSSLLRRVLHGTDAPEVPLRDELAFLHDYLDVQRIRFQGRLDVEEHVDDGLLDALVPPLLLQPLVENAVGHGVSRLESGVGVIRLGAERRGGRLVLTVEDNGPGLTSLGWRSPTASGAQSTGGVGLTNSRARLETLYGNSGTLDLRPAVGGGVVAEITLPLRLPASGDGLASAPPALSDV